MVDETGRNVGLVPIERALLLADERGLNLVEVAAGAMPPVCRLIDYGKYRYELSRAERKAKAKQREIEVKEVRLSYKMAENDRNIRLNRAREWLNKGDKVKVDLRLRGREQMFASQAENDVLRFRAELEIPTIIEQFPKKMGNRIIAVLAPDLKGKNASQNQPNGG